LLDPAHVYRRALVVGRLQLTEKLDPHAPTLRATDPRCLQASR
jgi:hypothetical protein